MKDSTQTEILIAGAVAAFTVDLAVYPLDTWKTRYQSQDVSKTVGTTAHKAKLLRNSFKGLYQGIGSVIFATLPAAGLFFLTYESTKSGLESSLSVNVPRPAIHSVASAIAELASCAILTPAEVVKQNAQVLQRSSKSNHNRSSSLEALQMVWRSEGGVSRRFWAGYTALAARNLPFTALQFPLFELFRGYVWKSREADNARLRPDSQAGEDIAASGLMEVGLVTGVSAAMAGSLAALITSPMDFVKTKMMLLDADSRDSPNKSKKLGGLEVAKLVLRERGILGLFRGAALRVSWTALGSGLYLGSYEMAKIWLKGGSTDQGGLR